MMAFDVSGGYADNSGHTVTGALGLGQTTSRGAYVGNF